jgi:hypothetical protein
VTKALKEAMEKMREAGFEIRHPIQVAVDPKLPFMGYTMPEGRSFKVVISSMAVDSGMLQGLLLHELSHAYRMQTNHPSHDGQLAQEVINNLGSRALSPDYKLRIIRDLVNDIEDLYADRIAVKAMTEGRVISKNQLAEFLQSWVKDEPVESGDPERDRWLNLSIMEKNARAISQMRKQRITDTDDKAKNSNKRFLQRLPSEMSRHEEYFQNVLSNLGENITEEAYRSLLTEYLNNFVKIAETGVM